MATVFRLSVTEDPTTRPGYEYSTGFCKRTLGTPCHPVERPHAETARLRSALCDLLFVLLFVFFSPWSLPSFWSLASSLAHQLDIDNLIRWFSFLALSLPSSCLVFRLVFRGVLLLVHQLHVS